MRKYVLPIIFAAVAFVMATTFHTLPFNGQNYFADDEDFPTSTDTIFAYCTWDDQYLYLAYSGDFLATPNDTVRSNVDMFWYIDTDPHPDNPKSGKGTDSTGAYYTQIMPSFPWWFDEQRWTLPFYADYRIQGDYDRKDSVYAHIQPYDDANHQWSPGYDLDTTMANLNYVDGYYELRIPLDSLGNPPEIFILGHLVSNEWKSDLYYDPDPQREVGGTLGSWPWSSIEGGDGDHNEDGHFDHWFHFHLQPGIHPDQENDPPVASDIPDQTIDEGQSFAVIDLNSYVFDDLTPDTLLTWTTQTTDLIVTILDSNQAQVTTPTSQWNGTETIMFIVTDEGGKSDTTYGTFTVNGDNQIPVAVNDADTTAEETAVSINLTANDSDADGDSLRIDRILNTNNGSVTIDNDSMVTYTPVKDFNGTDTFDYVVTDGNGGRDTATVSVTVTPINDPPQIVNLPDVINLETNSSTQLYMMDYAYDVDTPDSLLTWTFEINDPTGIGYAYDDSTDTLTIYSYDISGDFYVYCTLTDDSGAYDQDTITVHVSLPSGIETNSQIPNSFTVLQNYPNPFNPSTTIRYGLAHRSEVRIEVFNILGQPIYRQTEHNVAPGFHSVTIDAHNWAAGIYFYQIHAENRNIIKKMVLVK